MAESFPELRAAAIDGRAHNIYYRQHQLEMLHQALLDHASELREAIAAEYDYTPAEVAVELHLALGTLKRNYDSLQPTKAYEDEYALANSKDASARRVPAGIVYVQTCSHALLFSVIAPLSAAIAAGNCVIVLVSFSNDVYPSVISSPHLNSWRTTCAHSQESSGRHCKALSIRTPSP